MNLYKMTKQTKIAYGLWLSRCKPSHRGWWKQKALTMSDATMELVVACILARFMGGRSKFGRKTFKRSVVFWWLVVQAYCAEFRTKAKSKLAR